MNNWLKIGLPVVVAILLVVSAVAITLAVTSGSTSAKVVPALYKTQGTSNAQPAGYANCDDCPQNGSCNGDGAGRARAGATGSCCDTDDTGVYVPKTNSGGGCCSAR